MMLIAAYPATGGPLCYAAGRGWISRRALDPYFAPIEATIGLPGNGRLADRMGEYVAWCGELGERHAAPD